MLVDETASMDFGTVEVEKADLATWVTGAVGLLSDGPGNRMGVAHLRGDGVAWSSPLPPRRAAVRAMQRSARGRPSPPCGHRPRCRRRPRRRDRRPRRAPPPAGGAGGRLGLRRAGRPDRAALPLGGAVATPRRTPRRARGRGGRPARALPARRRARGPRRPRDRSPVRGLDLAPPDARAVRRPRRGRTGRPWPRPSAPRGPTTSSLSTDRDWVVDLARFVNHQRLPRHGGRRPGSPR